GKIKIERGTCMNKIQRFSTGFGNSASSLPGCHHICTKEFPDPQCCPGFWGPDCMECPGGSETSCNNRGACSDGMQGHGTCVCQAGFAGTACERCADDMTYGPDCTSVCECVHGACSSGVTGNGACTCFTGYTGLKCNQPIPECESLQCPENSRCTVSETGILQCKCKPNYEGDGKTCKPIISCLRPGACDRNAHCAHLGPNQHKCTCMVGYEGDGQVCFPVNPCQQNFGNCPPQSSVCVYDGPGKAHCECKDGYENWVPGIGCSLIDICKGSNVCSEKANCTTTGPRKISCTCHTGYVGNGISCYGNIMERIKQLNTEPGGRWQGRLSSAIELFDTSYSWPLSSLGPFTIFVPTNFDFKKSDIKKLMSSKQKSQYLAKLHLVAGELYMSILNKTDSFCTLTGKLGVTMYEKENQFKIRIYGSKKTARVLQGDLVASNGLVHIIDKVMDNVEPTLESDIEDTILEILSANGKFNRFKQLLQKTNQAQMLDQPGPYTVFAPTNSALDTMIEGTLDYLLSSEGSRKLLELIRHHIVPSAELDITNIVSSTHTISMTNQALTFNVTGNGRILVNGEEIKEGDILARNGRLYTMGGVLVPPSIMPILPHRCDESVVKSMMGQCVSCSSMHQSCPADSTSLDIFTRRCTYTSKVPTNHFSIFGCAAYCNKTVKIPKCCKGFYGPECSPCPGGFSNPCSGNGKCVDGIDGNGTCICNSNFKGSACQFCSGVIKFGPNCDKKCFCLHGECDNKPNSDGACKPASCELGYAGKFCDRKTSPCGPLIQYCHAHANCDSSNGAVSCVCESGYVGDGTECEELNPCTMVNNGGCSPNAECLKTGPGKHRCQCLPGWTGDGEDCTEINNCLSQKQGGCHENASCIYIGPGQNDCECKEGFRGDGVDCEPVNACLEQSDRCHYLATCQSVGPGLWKCVCQQGYAGDGTVCYGNAAAELLTLPEASEFHKWINDVNLSQVLAEAANITILVPTGKAIERMNEDDKAYWTTKENLPNLVKYHMLTGVHRFEDLQNLFSSSLPTSLHSNFISLANGNGNVTIQGANIIAGDIAVTNGAMHIIDKVLTPDRTMNTALPDLLTRLDQMPEYSIFRGYIIQYDLAKEIEGADAYTIFPPSNDAILSFVKDKKAGTLDDDLIRYHIILEDKLMKKDLHNGMHRETMLGFSYQVGFFIRNEKVPISVTTVDYLNITSLLGIPHKIYKILQIQKLHFSYADLLIIKGKCTECHYQPGCPPGTKPLKGVKKHCIFSLYIEGTRFVYLGCKPQCVKNEITRDCCYGYFGAQCQACPGKKENPCFGNGICLDGINGTGVCQCEEGFSGIACETCIERTYGSSCDQECTCVHGKCSEGINGDGSCECEVGWRGVKCDTVIRNDRCNKTCHTSANILSRTGFKTSLQCLSRVHQQEVLDTVVDACETKNGGCSANADCKRTTPGNRVCVCAVGYTGDGIICFEINPCLENNGGCDTNAECTRTGPDQAACNCLKGYSGDGKTCNPINPCRQNNGGCSAFATCNHTGPSERKCTCKSGYIGDGFKCRGTIFQELSKDPDTSPFFNQLKASKVRDLATAGPFTAFVPNAEAMNSDSRINQWTSSGQLAQVLRYHIIACNQLLYTELTSVKMVVSLHGESISISQSQNSLYLNDNARILSSDKAATNGIIHIINKVLVPQKMQTFSKNEMGVQLDNLTKVAEANGYGTFSKLLQDTDVLSLVSDPIHRPVTLFWPTDSAMQALPKDQQDFLFHKDNQKQLREYIKFHVIRDAKIFSSVLPVSESLRTLQGSDLSVKCNAKNSTGELFLNDRSCKIVQRQLEFDGGIAYGINCLLTPPTVGGRCDILVHSKFLMECGLCSNTPVCPSSTKPTGHKEDCVYRSWLPVKFLAGCRVECAVVISQPKCCKNFFGKDCQACPGGPEAPCSYHGTCDEGHTGTGQCKCNPGFNGTACELCTPGRYGSTCRPCECAENGDCDDGYYGLGDCTCKEGWTGRQCQTKLAEPPLCSPPCSGNGICRENNTCECRPYYEGDGRQCTVVDRCQQNNGGCHKNAKCAQNSTTVTCTCAITHFGDGYACIPIDPCTNGSNGGCHEHATCTMTGPNKRRCECKANYIGDGVNCIVTEQLINRCLQDNGHCHSDADCTDLHYEDSTVGVFHLQSPKGRYKFTYSEAQEACKKEGAIVATYNQLSSAQMAGFHLCVAGWLDGYRVAYPTAYSSPKCGSGQVGIIDYGTKNGTDTWDVYCYRVKG
uniref:Stabilin 2 n=1 Tax=Latimeria chalumnae TaxID=7897 RepID=H3AR94_LATCH